MQFVSQREGSFMGLSEETLFECSHFCTGAFGPAAATRRLLQMSLQTCFRAKNHLLMGQIYSQLVSSSASRAVRAFNPPTMLRLANLSLIYRTPLSMLRNLSS